VLSRQELAEAVNASVFEQTGRRCFLDGRYIATLERGETRWPSARYRAALRAVLGATTDAEIGLFIIRGAGRPEETTASVLAAAPSGDLAEIEAVEAVDVAPVGADQHTGSSLLRALLVERHWQVYRTFRAQFLRAARALAVREGDRAVGMLDVSERQFRRWMQGALPRPDGCRVLESMFGQPIDRLIGPADAGAATAVDVARPAALLGAVGGGLTGPEALAGPAAVQVYVSAGAAVTVMCHDDASGRVAVVAGAVRVLIDASGTEAASLTPGVVDAPMVAGGARVYSLAERRAR
jgi:hypothetical protein